MRIDLGLDQDATRQWHLSLAERLARLPGAEVGIRWSSARPPRLPSSVGALLALERVLHRLPPGGGFAAVGPEVLSPRVGQSGLRPDLVVDLAGGHPSAGAARWRLLFDGAPGETPLLGALLAGRTPVVTLVDAESGAPVAEGHPGTETPHIVASSLDDVLARAATLVTAAVEGRRGLRHDRPTRASTAGSGRVALFSAKAVARAALHRIYRLLYRTPHWRVGYRVGDGPATLAEGRHPEGGWHDLPDDGLRFYADPFPLVADGRTWLFVEDLEHRTGKGVISAVAFEGERPVGAPRPVLELACHLSYPFVFAHDGEIWMIPETSAAKAVDLFRATRFPGGWVHEARLVEGIEASDATPFRHEGRWWMSAAVRDGGGSSSDALHLWSAPDIRGPWTPHPENPVLVDVATARPAGRVERWGGRLLRPVQDGRGGYGAALGIAEITRLDPEGFAQSLVARLEPGPLWAGRKLHTLNRAGRLEVIDGSALSPRFGPGRRAAGRVPEPARPTAVPEEAPSRP